MCCAASCAAPCARHLLGAKEPFLYRLVPAVVVEMKEAYPQWAAKEKNIVAAIREEEDNFFATLEQGMRAGSRRPRRQT